MRSKRWKLLTIVFTVCLIAPVFSAVESVKVGGDIAVYGVLRSDFFINPPIQEDMHFFQTSARVYVEATLTDNVVGTVRLINESVWWGGESTIFTNRNIGLDLANIKITNLGASPITLTVGRQEIQFGEGLVVGGQYNAYGYPNFLEAPELGLEKAFDAIRIDYAAEAVPVKITGVLAKIGENVSDPEDDDETLYALNFGFKTADIADIEAYYVRLDGIYTTDGNIDTAGLRVVSSVPAIEGLKLKGEYAKQFGDDGGTPAEDYEGWALLLGVEYAIPVNMNPVVKVNYNLFTGDDNPNDNDIEDWMMIFPSNIASRIGPVWYAYDALNSVIGGETNLSVINAGISFTPVEKLKIGIDGYFITAAEEIAGEDDIGTEVDLNIEYAYTEDLTFGLSVGFLTADDLIETASGDDCWQAIASMKLTF